MYTPNLFMHKFMDKDKVAGIIIEEYKSAISIFQATVDRYYKLFASILTISSILFGTLYHYKIHEGFVLFVFLFLAFISLESYLRFTAAANAIYTEHIEKKINLIYQYDVLEWYHKTTHGKFLLTPKASKYSILFLSRYIPFILLLFIFLGFSYYESYMYLKTLTSLIVYGFHILVLVGLSSVIVFNISFAVFLKRYRLDLEQNLKEHKRKAYEVLFSDNQSNKEN